MRRRLHRDSPVPVWAQIEEALAARIGRGELRVGDRLPAERDLADELSVSRGTIRQALDALAARGLVERGVGRGTFVAAGKVDVHLHDVAGFTEQLARAGLEAHARVLRAGVGPAPEQVAAALGLEEGASVVRIERLRLAGRLPVTLEDSYVPSARFPGIEELDLRGSIYQLMRDLYGHAPVRVVEALEPVIAQPHSAEVLGVAAGCALMLVERTAYDADGVAVEYARDLHRGDRARFLVEAAAPVSVTDQAQAERDGDGVHAVVGVELVHGVLGVGAHGRGGEEERLADALGRQPMGEVLQDLGLALAQQRGGDRVAGKRRLEHRVDVWQARMDGAYRSHQLLGRAALDDEAARPRVERRLQRLRLGAPGVEHDRRRIRARRDLAAAFDAVDRRHPDVDDGHVGAPAFGKAQQLAPVCCLPDHPEVILRLEHGHQSPA